jgi:hypothetical protein
VTTTGGAYCWGENATGQLGNGSSGFATSALIPSPVDVAELPAGTRFASIEGGTNHTCAITVTGATYCWGADSGGQLGNGPGLTSQQNRPSPVDLSGLPAGATFVALATPKETSAQHTCAVAETGVAYCWGNDANGVLGNGAAGASPSPTRVDVAGLPAGATWTELSAGRNSTCGLTAAGTAWCWGSDSSGQLGNGTSPASVQQSPSEVLWPTAIEAAIADPAELDPAVTPVSAVVGNGETLVLGGGLVTATYADPSGGTGKVLLARYAPGYQPVGTAIVINGVVYDVHFAPTATTGPAATLAVAIAGLTPDQPLLAWDGLGWAAVISNDGTAAIADADGRVTTVFGPASTPTLLGLAGTALTTEVPTPTSRDDCTNGGWQRLYTVLGASFANQGTCIAYANTRR